MSDIASLIAGIREAVNALRGCEPDLYELADATADIRRIEVELAEWRREQEKRAGELEPLRQPEPVERIGDSRWDGPAVLQGDRYELVKITKTVRSYNSPAILSRFAGKLDAPVSDVLRMLVQSEAVKLSWQWQKLQKAARQMKVPLNVGYDEVSDDDGLDGPMVGEITKDAGFKRVPIKRGEETK